ncbi:hypothetical protein PENTCL1PPCAC_26894, partial [Pristionchus entomophagus]
YFKLHYTLLCVLRITFYSCTRAIRSRTVSFADQDMPPNALSPSKRMIVRKVCVVGDCKDSQAIQLLQTEYNVEVVHSDDGTGYLDQPDEFVFVVESFTSDLFIRLRDKTLRVMSPKYIRSRYHRHFELIAPRPGRPLYCELLKDMTLVMTNVPNKGLIANLTHFLGGSIRKDVIERTTHVIATSVHCKQYRSAFSMGVPILRPEYIQHIWEKRDELVYEILSAEVVRMYRLLPFEGLKIAFVGFSGEEMIDMEKQVKKYRGEVVRDERLATHVVFNAKGADLPKVEQNQGQMHLTSEWLWQSVQMEGCAGEDNYMMKHAPTKKTSRGVFSPMTTVQANIRSTRSASNVLDTSNSSVLTNEYSTDDLDKVGAPSPKRIDKRHQVCMEMLETEQSYLRALGLVVKFKDALELEVEKGGEGMVTKEDIHIMFSKFTKIIKVHTEICEKLRTLVEEWRPENEVGRAWMEAESQLMAVYPPFINSFDTIKGTLDNLDMTNQRFHVFLKAQEASPEYRRNTMRDLIIRPVQRLPSVMLLLKEIDKRTDSKLADKESLKVAEKTITTVLESANGRRAMNDDFSRLFQLCNQIAELPPYLYKANREYVIDLECEVLGGTGMWKGHAKRTLKFLLFNDILEIAKVRRFSKDAVNGRGTISRLTRQLSVSNLRNLSLGVEARPYRHVSDVLLTSLRLMYYVFAGDVKLLVMVIRGDTEGDEELVLMPPDEVESRSTRNFVTALSASVYTQCGRDIGPTYLGLNDTTSMTVQDIVKKVIYKRGLANSTMSGSMILPQDMDDSMMPLGNTTNMTFSRGGGFRRALSNASLTISKKLHISRANLRSINEQGENSPGFLPQSGASSIASSISPVDRRGGEGNTYTPTSRYSGHRQTSLRSLFSFTSRSSIKRRESGKENNENPAQRFSTQSTQV